MQFVSSVVGLIVIAGTVHIAVLGIRLPVVFAHAERIVYVGTYTGETSKGIYAFRFDDASGVLSFLTASANGRFVFAVNELQSFRGEPSGSVTSFAVDSGSATLTELSVQPSMGSGPCHLALDRTGRYLAVANYGGGNYALFPVSADGRLQPATGVVTGAGPGSPKPLGHMVGFDGGNRFLIAADKGLDRMLVYRFDESTGALSANQPASATLPTGSGPRHYAFHPNGTADPHEHRYKERDVASTTLRRDARSTIVSLPLSSVTSSTLVNPTGVRV